MSILSIDWSSVNNKPDFASLFVPFTGAASDVNLGTRKLTAGCVKLRHDTPFPVFSYYAELVPLNNVGVCVRDPNTLADVSVQALDFNSTGQFNLGQSGSFDVHITRNATGPMAEIRANGGLAVKDRLGTAFTSVQAGGFRVGAGTELFDGNLRRTGSFVFRHNIDGKPSMRNWAETNGVTFDHSTAGLLNLRNYNDTAASNLQVGALQFGNVNAALFKQSATNYVEAVTGFSMGAGTSSGVAMQSGGITAGPNASIGFNASNGIGSSDVRLVRNATGPTLETRAAGGLRVMNADGSAASLIQAGSIVVGTGTHALLGAHAGSTSFDSFVDFSAVGSHATNRWAVGIDHSLNRFAIAKNAGGSGIPFGIADLLTLDGSGNLLTAGNITAGTANTTTKQTDSAFQFSRTLDGIYVGSISRGTNSTANSVAIDYEANAGHFFKLAGATIASIGSTALTAGAGFLGIQNVHSLYNLTGAANNVLTITSDAAAGTVDGFVIERSTRSPVGNNKIVSFRYNGAVVASIGQYGDLSLRDKVTAIRPTFASYGPYMQCINESGRSEVELQQGLIAGYGGTVSCRAGDVANTGYFRMRYDTGYPKLETNANTLTLSSSTQSLTISTAYMSFGPTATPWLYLDGGTHKSRSSSGFHVRNLADTGFADMRLRSMGLWGTMPPAGQPSLAANPTTAEIASVLASFGLVNLV